MYTTSLSLFNIVFINQMSLSWFHVTGSRIHGYVGKDIITQFDVG